MRSSRGFDAPVYAETLWEAARRQGKRVITIATMADGTTPERSADLTLAFGRRLGTSLATTVVTRDRHATAETWNLGNEKLEHAQELLAASDGSRLPTYEMEAGRPLRLAVLGADTRFDRREAYDTLYLDFDRDLSNGFAARLRAGQWAAIVLRRASPQIGCWVKALEVAEDLSRVRLYFGAPQQNRGSPAGYIEDLERELGFWPGEPDNDGLEEGRIDEQTWLEQAERLSNYLRDATLVSMRRYPYDLLLTYQALLDEVEEKFLVRQPRQLDYSEEGGRRRARFEEYVEHAYRSTYENLKRLREAAPTDTYWVVASDHGIAPLHTRVALNAVLAQAGLKVTGDATTEVRAYTSGSTAHIYVNLAGRESGGVVPPKQLRQYVERIVKACRQLRDPATGERVFEKVLTREELLSVRLGHPLTAGDVWVNARPGYDLISRLELPTVEAATTVRAMHGYLGNLREMHAIFFVVGPGIRPATLPPMTAADVAPTVSALLRIAPPRHNEGRVMVRPAR